MAVIHHTTLRPTKLELLTHWLPTRTWYHSGDAADLTRVGGFRLDDPAGEVGIEFMVVSNAEGAAYLVPMTYRGAPLDGADDTLIGTTHHGVLGQRWIYDGTRDPVLVAQLLAFMQGAVLAQAQHETDTTDPTVHPRTFASDAFAMTALHVEDDDAGTHLHVRADSRQLEVTVTRALRAGELPHGVGGVSATWTTGDGATARGVFATAAEPRLAG